MRDCITDLEQQLKSLRMEYARALANGSAKPADELTMRNRLQGIDGRNMRIRTNTANRWKAGRIAKFAEQYAELAGKI
ncbi:hypothetical protein [Leucobacter iarius]|uniref:Uncharacterized protein n=1 Tax=Leucobacter iarius TaxID=333963 RepID=A0ABN2LJR7_9MICO